MSDDAISPFSFQLLSIVATKAELDEFDLQHAGLDACVRFRLLRRVYVSLIFDLISMIEDKGEQLRQQLSLMLRDS